MTKKEKEEAARLEYMRSPYQERDQSVYLNQNELGLGLGNINVPGLFNQNYDMSQYDIQRANLQQAKADVAQAQMVGMASHKPGIERTQIGQPILGHGQQYGANVYANTNPNLNYVKYGGTVAAGLGDMTLAYEKAHDVAQGFRGDTNTTTVQYTPSQLAGLIAEAKYTQNQNNHGYDGTNISGGVAYSQGPWNASITGNKRYDNQGNEDKNILANIGYRW